MATTGLELDTEVVVVGAGPVGLCLAVELGRRGVDCVVLEQRAAGAPTFPTANHLGVRTMEHLRRLGLADEVRTAFRPDWGGAWVALTHLGGFEVGRFDDALAGTVDRVDSPERETWAPKPWLDPILESAAGECRSVRLEYGVRVEAVQDGRDGIFVNGHTDSGSVTVRARFAVACDGGGSTVRETREFAMVGPERLPFEIHSAYFRSRWVGEAVPHGGVQYTILGTADGPTPFPVGAGVMVAVDGRELWRLHGPGLDAGDAGITRARLAELGVADAEILAMTAWTPAQAIAAVFGDGPVFLAGDAAHLVTPFGGLGVNIGMADAFDLGWKLDATLRGWGGPRLLDESYDHERRIAAIELLEYQGVDFSGAEPTRTGPVFVIDDAPDPVMWGTGAAAEAARRAHGAAMAAVRSEEFDKPRIDLGTRYDTSPVVCAEGDGRIEPADVAVYEPTSRPGGRAPHVTLGAGRSTLDLFGPEFVLLRTAEADPEPLERAARDAGVPIRVETHPEAAGAYATALTLVRPDGMVAWRGDDAPASPGAVVDRVRGA